jgi:hypothetical protein
MEIAQLDDCEAVEFAWKSNQGYFDAGHDGMIGLKQRCVRANGKRAGGSRDL